MEKIKKLYRSKKDRMITGVCGGIAEYSNSDPTIVRLLWSLITILTGFIFGVIAYLAASVIIPER